VKAVLPFALFHYLVHTLDAYPIVKRKDEAAYREYRTKRMILEKYEEVESLIR
jgi:hypothetical protein